MRTRAFVVAYVLCGAALLLAGACGDDGAHRATGDAGGGSDGATATDARSLSCASDGGACTTATGDGVCCNGACVTGACCTSDDCAALPGDGPGYICTADHTCENVAGSLTGLLWELPCTSDATGSCPTNATSTMSTTLAGAAGLTYDVTVHVRGVVELKTYDAACAAGDGWAIAGTPAGDTYNIYELEISSPPQTYYLNAGTSGNGYCSIIDYQHTLRVDANATVTLYAASIDNAEIDNVGSDGVTPLSIAGTVVTQPYDGQFVQLDVLSVVPDPIATTATVGSGSAGSALEFAGAQVATIATTSGLSTPDVTTEAWFEFGMPSGQYNTILGKTYGTGTYDTYTTWYQGTLNSGLTTGSNAIVQTDLTWTPSTTTWHHTATTYDSTTGIATFYIDGQQAACYAATGPLAYDSHAILIGGDIENGAPDGFWYGAIDEVRVFSIARTPDQIWADMHTHRLGATTSLVGEWTFDDGSGQTAADSSGAGNAAVLGSTTAVEADDPTWIVSGAPH